ncbi:MAG: Flp pilus assembly complex ATPase component TadA, partial [Clostridiales bacterium]|nr:Flp pilus assembly complex ATPase component TadA [Clostridiales bacterium]
MPENNPTIAGAWAASADARAVGAQAAGTPQAGGSGGGSGVDPSAQAAAASPGGRPSAQAASASPSGGGSAQMDFNALLEYACKCNATDLHIGVGRQPVMRVGSVLDVIPGTEAVMPKAAEDHVRAIVDDAQFETLRSVGEIDFSFSRSGLGRFRANIYKQRNTFGIAIRSLPFNIPPFDSLGLPAVIKSFAKRSKGLVLSTGPTGSGKTTTLASIVDIINAERKCHIITIEDPIEYLHRHK